MIDFSSSPPLVRVLDLSEGENLVGGRLLNLLDPAAVIVGSVAATTRDVVVNGTEVIQLNAVYVSGRCYEDGAVKFAVSTALPIEGGCAVSHNKDNAVPTGVAVVVEVAGHNQQAIAGVRAQIKAAVNVDRLGIGSRHGRPRVARSVIGVCSVAGDTSGDSGCVRGGAYGDRIRNCGWIGRASRNRRSSAGTVLAIDPVRIRGCASIGSNRTGQGQRTRKVHAIHLGRD